MLSGVRLRPRASRSLSVAEAFASSVKPVMSFTALSGAPPAMASATSGSPLRRFWDESHASASSFDGTPTRSRRDLERIVGSTASMSSAARMKTHPSGGSSIDLSSEAAASARTMSAG